MKFDDLLENHIGSCGNYQIVIVILFIYIYIPGGFSIMELVFVFLTPDHWCKTPTSPHLTNLTQQDTWIATSPGEWKEDGFHQDACLTYNRSYANATQDQWHTWLQSNGSGEATVSCQNWEYSAERWDDTVVTEFNLVCERKWLIALTQSINMAGVLLGTLVTGILADRFGRKPVSFVCFILHFAARISCAFSVNLAMFAALRFCIGFNQIALFNSAYVSTMEIVGSKWRGRVKVITGMSWSFAFMLVGGVAYLVPQWSMFMVVGTLTNIPTIIYLWLVYESPRWLYMVNRHQKADEISRAVSKFNKSKVPGDISVEKQMLEKQETALDLVKTRNMRTISLISFYIWFTTSLVYYGLTFATPSLKGSLIVNYTVSGSMDLVGVFYVLFLVDTRMGRMWTLRLLIFLAGVPLLLTLAVPEDQVAALLVLTMVGKSAVSGMFTVIYLLAMEQFPTLLRAKGLGTSSMFARVGAMIAPFIVLVGDDHPAVPTVTFGVLCLVAGGLTFLMTETRGKPLPECVDDVEKSRRNRKTEQFSTKLENGGHPTTEPCLPQTETTC